MVSLNPIKQNGNKLPAIIFNTDINLIEYGSLGIVVDRHHDLGTHNPYHMLLLTREADPEVYFRTHHLATLSYHGFERRPSFVYRRSCRS